MGSAKDTGQGGGATEEGIVILNIKYFDIFFRPHLSIQAS